MFWKRKTLVFSASSVCAAKASAVFSFVQWLCLCIYVHLCIKTLFAELFGRKLWYHIYHHRYPEIKVYTQNTQIYYFNNIIIVHYPNIGGSNDKESAHIVEDPGSIPGSGRTPGEGNGNPLQYSCLGNSMDRGAWLATKLDVIDHACTDCPGWVSLLKSPSSQILTLVTSFAKESNIPSFQGLLLLISHSCVWLCDAMDCSMPGLSVLHHLWSLLKFMFIASVMPSSHLTLWCPLLLLPSIFPSIRGFSVELSVLIKWPK